MFVGAADQGDGDLVVAGSGVAALDERADPHGDVPGVQGCGSRTAASIARNASGPQERGRRGLCRSGGTCDGSSSGLLLGVGGVGPGGRPDDSRQMHVQVLDFDVAAAVPEGSGKEFCKSAGCFPD